MQIYLVMYNDFHGVDHLHGAYETEKEARACIARFGDDTAGFRIDPYTLGTEYE